MEAQAWTDGFPSGVRSLSSQQKEQHGFKEGMALAD